MSDLLALITSSPSTTSVTIPNFIPPTDGEVCLTGRHEGPHPSCPVTRFVTPRFAAPAPPTHRLGNTLGGSNAPYVLVDKRKTVSSMDVDDDLMQIDHVVNIHSR